MFAHQPPKTAAQGEPRNAGNGDKTARSGKTVGLQRVVYLTPVAPPFCAEPARWSVNGDALHPRQINHQALIAHSEAANVMAGSAYRKEQILMAREINRPDCVIAIDAPSDERGSPVDRRIKYGTCCVVPLVAWGD